MAKDKDENGDGGKTENVQVMAMMAQALQMLAANQPKPVMDESSPEYQALLRSRGFFDTFDKTVTQNGIDANPQGLPEQTRFRAARLAAGTYCDGKLRVTVGNSGQVNLHYDAKGDKQNSFYSKYATAAVGQEPSFAALIDRIWGEMEAKQPAAVA